MICSDVVEVYKEGRGLRGGVRVGAVYSSPYITTRTYCISHT